MNHTEALKGKLSEKISQFSESRLQEVLHFVDFLATREREKEDPILNVAGCLSGRPLSAEQGRHTTDLVTSERFASSWRHRKRFQDKTRISFTDLTSMILMEERGIKQEITEEEHFRQVGLFFQKLPKSIKSLSF